MHGRFPQLQVAVAPSNAYTRRHAGILLDRVLQTSTTGKSLEFLGLCADERLGGDGAVLEEAAALSNSGWGWTSSPGRAIDTAASARNAMMIAAHTHKQLKQVKGGGSGSVPAVALSHPAARLPAAATINIGKDGLPANNTNAMPNPRALDVLLTQSLSDHADPISSLGFLTCTLNSTNQILHPCILVALFGGDDGNVGPNDDENDDGTITWNPRKELTPLPRFYADGAARPLAGELITAIAGGEMYFVIDALERLLSPRGYDPITALHGGEPIGRRVMNYLKNSPHDLGERSGLTGAALRREWRATFGGDDASSEAVGGDVGNSTGLINREGLLAKLMSYGLSHNSRLGAVLSPCIIDESSKGSDDGTIRIRPNPATRFFTDDVQHGLCIYLGLAEILGFDLERDMRTTLYVVRRLQRWMKKEFVLPVEGGAKDGNGKRGRSIVGSARDLAETSAPQAFGVNSIQELKHFLKLDIFGEKHQSTAEDRLMGSELVSRL